MPLPVDGPTSAGGPRACRASRRPPVCASTGAHGPNGRTMRRMWRRFLPTWRTPSAPPGQGWRLRDAERSLACTTTRLGDRAVRVDQPCRHVARVPPWCFLWFLWSFRPLGVRCCCSAANGPTSPATARRGTRYVRARGAGPSARQSCPYVVRECASVRDDVSLSAEPSPDVNIRACTRAARGFAYSRNNRFCPRHRVAHRRRHRRRRQQARPLPGGRRRHRGGSRAQACAPLSSNTACLARTSVATAARCTTASVAAAGLLRHLLRRPGSERRVPYAVRPRW